MQHKVVWNFSYMRRQLSILFKVKFLLPAKKTPTIIDKNFKTFNKKSTTSSKQVLIILQLFFSWTFFCMVVLKLLLLPSYCEAPDPEQPEAEPSLKALATPGLCKRTPVLLYHLLF